MRREGGREGGVFQTTIKLGRNHGILGGREGGRERGKRGVFKAVAE